MELAAEDFTHTITRPVSTQTFKLVLSFPHIYLLKYILKCPFSKLKKKKKLHISPELILNMPYIQPHRENGRS